MRRTAVIISLVGVSFSLMVHAATTTRDIFSPPAGRQSSQVKVPSLPTVSGFNVVLPSSSTSTIPSSTIPSTTARAPVSWEDKSPVTAPLPTPVKDDYYADSLVWQWLPYALIIIGAVGFAWGVRGQRRKTISLPVMAKPPVVNRSVGLSIKPVLAERSITKSSSAVLRPIRVISDIKRGTGPAPLYSKTVLSKSVTNKPAPVIIPKTKPAAMTAKLKPVSKKKTYRLRDL